MVNRRQFIISKKKYERKGFLTKELNNGYYLSFHLELNVTELENDSIVLGYAFSCKSGEGISLTDNVEESICEWAGRWVLLTNGFLYLDAVGSLGVFYGWDEQHNILCSSSLALLHELIPRSKWVSNIEIHRGEFCGFDYYPGPFTPWSGCKELLPSQKIDLVHGVIINRTDFNFRKFQNISSDKLIDMIIETEGNILKNIKKQFDSIYLPLTGGVDSRSILAVALVAGVDVNLYTIRRIDTEPWDLDIPKTIARKLNIPYQQFVEKEIANDERLEKIYQHCGGRITDGTEITQYLNGIDVGRNKVVLWGPVWEIGIHYYSQYYPNGSGKITDSVKILKLINEYSQGMLDKSRVHGLSFNDYVSYICKNPIPGMDWLDRLYWEERAGTWAKNSLQMIDMYDSIRIIPVNCQRVIECLIAFDPSFNTPTGKEAQKEMIRKCSTTLANIPYANRGYYLWRGMRKIKKLLKI